MSTTPNTPSNPAPPIDINTPAPAIAAANVASQATETPGQPRNPDGTFAAPAAVAPPAVVTPTAENPVVTRDLGEGKFQVEYLTGEKFEGTAAEVLAKVGQAHVNTKMWAKNQVQTPPPPPQVVEPPKSPFANEEEAAVATYTANLIAKTLGYPDAATMQRALGHIQENTTDYASQAVTLQFQAAQPDFNPTKENSDKLIEVITQSGMGQAFDSAERPQQVQMLRQAHAYCIMNKVYEPKPAGAAPMRVQAPPPPPPSGRAPVAVGALPENLVATMADTPEQIKAKWAEAQRLGYV